MKGGHKITVDLLILACAVLLFVQGIKMASMTTRQLTPTLHIPMSVIYCSLPVGAFGIILNGINNLLKRMAGPGRTEEITAAEDEVQSGERGER